MYSVLPFLSFLQEAVSDALSIGAPLLLPPLRERMELLHSLLPNGPDRWDSLSRGQVSLLSQHYDLLLHCPFTGCIRSLKFLGYTGMSKKSLFQVLKSIDSHKVVSWKTPCSRSFLFLMLFREGLLSWTSGVKKSV